jgi:PLP dependent protein
MGIFEIYSKLRKEIPSYVTIVVAAKTRTKEEVLEVIKAGATDIGYNYVQEAEKMYSELGDYAKKVNWHLIGHLQSGKVAKALKIFDLIQTIDSLKLAFEINKKAIAEHKIIPVLIEVNIAKESQKSGLMPESVEGLVREISSFSNIRVEGIMTMGSFSDDESVTKNEFQDAQKLFEKLKSLNLPNINIKTLSMGMSDSYNLAINCGANMVRIGTSVFGERN